MNSLKINQRNESISSSQHAFRSCR